MSLQPHLIIYLRRRRDFFGRLGPRGGRGRFGFFGPRGGRGFLGLLGGREIELEIGRRRTTDLRCAPNFPLVPRRTRSRLRDKFRLRAVRLIRALARRPCLWSTITYSFCFYECAALEQPLPSWLVSS